MTKELEEALLKVKDKNVELFIHYKNSILKTKLGNCLEQENVRFNRQRPNRRIKRKEIAKYRILGKEEKRKC